MKFNKFTLPILIIAGVCTFFFQNCGSQSSQGKKGKEGKAGGPDHTPPTLMLGEKPNSYSNSAQGRFQIITDDSGSGVKLVQYKLDDANWQTSGNIVNLEGLQSGNHRIFFRAYDQKDNVSEVLVYNWVVDDDKPTVEFSPTPAVVTQASTMKFTILPSDATTLASVESCQLDGVTVSCANNTYTATGVSFDQHIFRVVVSDQAKNKTVKVHVWARVNDSTVTPAPEFNKVEPYIQGGDVTLRITALDVTGIAASRLECKFNGVVQANCKPNVNFVVSTTAEGRYTYSAQLILSGKPSTITTVTWFVDKTPPVLALVKKPAKFSRSNDVIFNYTISDNSGTDMGAMKCAILNVTQAADCMPITDLPFNDLPAGDHMFRVVVVDKAGNESKLEYAWHNPSCNARDVLMSWPTRGNEGANYAVMSYFDTDRRESMKLDYKGESGNLARVDDNHHGITLTSGDVTTLTSEFAKVYAMADGEVTNVRNNQANPAVVVGDKVAACRATANHEDNFIVIRHDNGFSSSYSYLKGGSIPFAKGAKVKRGDLIGIMGTSGCLKYPRVFFDVESCTAGQFVDPVGVMQSAPAYNVPIKILGFSMHAGQLSDSDTTKWRALMQTPAPKSSFKQNTYMTIFGVISGGHSDEYIHIELIAPGNKTKIDMRYQKPTSSGKFLLHHSPKLEIKGTWKWRLRHEIRQNGQFVHRANIVEQTFTVVP